MRNSKKSKKSGEGHMTANLKRQEMRENEKLRLNNEFQESLREDMRGPLEGMEAVPPKQ